MFKNKPQQQTQNDMMSPETGQNITRIRFSDLGFDLNETELPSNNFKLLPAGEYQGIITHAEKIDSRNTVGCQMVKIHFTVTGPTRAGAVVFDQPVIHHPTSQEAIDIGRGKVKSLFLAVGVQSSDLEDLVAAQTEITAKIKIKKDKTGQYEDKNEIAAYLYDDNKKPQTAKPSTKPSFLRK